MPFPRNILTVIAVVALALAAGCSNSKPDEKTAPAHNSADVTFAQLMIPHHEQAIEMSALASTRAQSRDVKDLAAAIEGAQGPEIKTMKTWLASWGEDSRSGHMDHDMTTDGGMSGIMSAKTMKELEQSTGTAFDRLFLSSMIEHHQGAIDMAKDERRDGRYPAAVAMAGAIIKTQTAEIAQMRKLLTQ